MCKLLFVVPLVAMTASAQAGLSGPVIVASSEPAPARSAPREPVSKSIPPTVAGANAQAEDKPATSAKAKARKPQTEQARARRIAARFGISW